jgi:hypothetical protein
VFRYFHQTREPLPLFGGDAGAWEPPVGGALSAIAFYPPVSAAELVIGLTGLTPFAGQLITHFHYLQIPLTRTPLPG